MRVSRVLSVVGLVFGGVIAATSPSQAAVGPWMQVDGGTFHTCGITTAKSLYCWGSNLYGQTGDGTQDSPRLTLNRVGAAGIWASLAAGEHHTCGITTAGNLYCWGRNNSGQTGDLTTNTPRLTLNRVGAAGVWASVTGGFGHTCGITTAKNLYCWGDNLDGEIGDGTTTSPRLAPKRVGAAGVWTSVDAGGAHTCGITTAKNLYCWGGNGEGQTGDGTQNTPRLALNRVGAAGVWTSVDAGADYTCGITTAKNLYCWGNNFHGQTGDGTQNTPRLTLNRVGASGVWSRVSAGGIHTCGITTAKNLYCWGGNSDGETGDGTQNTPRLTLNRVAAAGVWASVNTGREHTCAVTSANNLYCWGYNSYGQTGDGTTNTPRLSLFRVT